MKLLLVCLLAILVSISNIGFVFAEKGSIVNEIIFIQYLDENTALEEVRNGNLDMYYYRISSDRIESSSSREGLKVFDSTGGSYSILVNPAESEKFNPFSIKEIRFALNYLVDRKLIVNELMGGFGAEMISYYSPYDPEYLSILNQLESFHFRYNPTLAEKMISDALVEYGATKNNDLWAINDEPIEITIFIRSDDPVRKSIGEILSSELEKIGFVVKKDFGDLNKAFVVVYGSNPADLKWQIYTEGWGRSAFVRYDSVGLGQMYSPWFSSMPGFNDPSYWNYKNEYLDSLTQRIYTGDFSSAQERTELIQQAILEGVSESVRIFLASKIDQYVVNEKIDGVINDFGAGVPTRFTPINVRSDSETLVIGVKQIYQGAWNPIMGLSDSYSQHIWGVISDPGVFKHPYTGMTFPIRTSWIVETQGPDGKMDLPDDAIIWDPTEHSWKNVESGSQSISKVTFDLSFSNWHHGKRMDMNDILQSLYFTIEWGSEPQEDDKTFDTEYTPRTSQIVNTIIGVKPLDEDTIEVYVDYWHFDESEIADWASMWSVMPWEIISAMEQAVIDGKVAFSRSGATSKNVNWLSLIVPNDAKIIQEYLSEFKQSGHIPMSLKSFGDNPLYFDSRYDASINWINENNHAVISNGPFLLDSYSPEARTIIISAFADQSYPIPAGAWSEFEDVQFPRIVNVDMPSIVVKDETLSIPVMTEDSTRLQYFFTNSEGLTVATGIEEVDENPTVLNLSKETTNQLLVGANDLKIFAISDSVLRPDIFRTSFLVVENQGQELPSTTISEPKNTSVQSNNGYIIIIGGLIILGIVLYVKYKYSKRVKV
ncbi:MAG: ABC transporter substrate-binding protein [Thaumarchaeota archaeon]|nr:ABC transporter substrate-binding protein [Nitrososphaerota archaeon]